MGRPAGQSEQATDFEATARARSLRLIEAESSLFGAQGDDARLATELMDGWVSIPPHGKVRLPEDPEWSEGGELDANWQVRYQSLTWLDVLRREGIRTADEAMLERYTSLLRSFVLANPSVGEARSEWTWFDHPAGHRSSVLAAAVSVLGLPDWLVAGMEAHAAAASDPEQYRGLGNHSLMQDSGLLSLGAVLGREDWFELALKRANTLLEQSIDGQGVTDEGSYSYQWSNYKWWSEMRRKVIASDHEPPRTWNRIDLMPRFVAHATQPTGRATPFGDVNVGARGPVVDVRPTETTAFFTRGYMFSRSGWGTDRPLEEESMVSLRYGQAFKEQAHGHMDAGNIEFFAYGTPLVTDSGMYAYNGGPWRNWVKSPQAHNVITVDGAAYQRDKISPLVFRRTAGTHTLASMWTTVIAGAIWRRTVLYSKLSHWVLVDDHLEQIERRRIVQRWNVPVSASLTVSPGERLDQDEPEAPGLSVLWLAGSPDLELREGWKDEDGRAVGWRSHQYGQITPSPTVEAWTDADRWHVTTLLAARPAGAEPATVSARDVEVDALGVKATVVTPHGIERVTVAPDGFTARPG